MWENIECKGCKTKNKRLFILHPPESDDDCWCEDCKEKELEKRSKSS